MQEYLELDLFHYGLAHFSPEEFEAAGITPEQQFLIQYMADQEVGHAQMITNILGGPSNASQPCTYAYPFRNVRDFIDFSSKMIRTIFSLPLSKNCTPSETSSRSRLLAQSHLIL